MMKFIFALLFMIPLSLFSKDYWKSQIFLFLLSFIFMLKFAYDYTFINISYILGVDLLSYLMILLSFWICSLMLLASSKLFNHNYYFNAYLLVVLILLISLFITFSSMNLFIFYLFFEVSLIPTLMLILGWGYQPERLQAGVYLLFYTLLASLPMMISVFYLFYSNNSLEFFLLKNYSWSFYFFICLNFVFFIKIPMYFVHLWLPKAHVEAPVSGSMILAGIMLKLGGYGLMRLLTLFSSIINSLNYIFVSISLVGGVIVSLMCLRQVDIKALIAYSSVAHMGLVLSGIMSLTYMGFSGALIMMIAHGLSSSALFCLANISYERINSRSLFINKGLLNIMPSMSLWWFLLSACNMASPPSLNLFGEIMLINSLVGWSNFCMGFLALISFFSCCYSLFLFSYSQHGKFNLSLMSFFSGQVREYLLLMLHWLPLNILIMKGDIVSLMM
uniref:NADH-ubiquinone oxidoreductase chain 4 n=1 Tax=Trachys variolaris TaxID=2823040 RepID=A0A8A6W657_9COLE|nr:NADH dehydrogenase subunit 4 [Trachys variolaris]QTK22444.1 NADH dehydrogenase subunit 4 [Trachys variolaris]